MDNTKITLKNDKSQHLLIENYSQIKTIENETIIVDKYIIKGENLKIKRLDEYYMYIVGIIKRIDIS